MSCNTLKPNYGTGKFDSFLPQKAFDQKLLDQINALDYDQRKLAIQNVIKDRIVSRFGRRVDFATKYENSKSQNRYIDSVPILEDDMINAYEKYFDQSGQENVETGKFNMQFDDDIKATIRTTIEERMAPNMSLTIEDELYKKYGEDSAIVDYDTMMSNTHKFDANWIYGNNESINMMRLYYLGRDIKSITMVNTSDNPFIVLSESLMNKSIGAYQQREYLKIREFLKKQGFAEYLMPEKYYWNDYEWDRGVNRTLLAMHNYIADRINTDKVGFYEELDSVHKKIIASQRDVDRSLYDAVNAYVTLRWFDKWINQKFSSWLDIHTGYRSLKHIDQTATGGKVTTYKYVRKFKKKQAGTKIFGLEYVDPTLILEDTSERLVEGIDMLDYRTNAQLLYMITMKDFIRAFSAMFDVANKINFSGDYRDEFVKSILYSIDDPKTRIKQALSILFRPEGNASLIDDFHRNNIDDDTISILYSAYRHMFVDREVIDYNRKGKRIGRRTIRCSLESIEADFLKNKGILNRFNFLDTLCGVIMSSRGLKFFRSSADAVGEVETSFINNSITDRNLFGIVYTANTTSMDSTRKLELLERYKLTDDGKNKYTLTIKGLPWQLTIIIPQGKILLDKWANPNSGVGFLDEENKLVLPKVDLTFSKRLELIAAKEAGIYENDADRLLMGLLSFADSMLGTVFSLTTDGLNELDMMKYLPLGQNSLLQITLDAVRALKVMQINYAMETAVKEDGSKYLATELLKFMDTEAYAQVYATRIDKMSEITQREYLYKRGNGMLLLVVSPKTQWLKNLSTARSLLLGDASSSVVRTIGGITLPIFSPYYPFADVRSWLSNILSDTPLAHNYFNNENRYFAIGDVGVNLQIKSSDGSYKRIKETSLAESSYDAIVNKWMAPILAPQSSSVYFLIAGVSDKTKIPLAEIILERLKFNSFTWSSNSRIKNIVNNGLAKGQDFFAELRSRIYESIGSTYKDLWNNIIEDYSLILDDVRTAADGEKVNALLSWLLAHTESDLMALVNAYNNRTDIPKLLVIKRQYHYRIYNAGGKEFLSLNEIVYNNAQFRYKDERALQGAFSDQMRLFVLRLLDNGTFFKVKLKTVDDGKKILFNENGGTISKFLFRAGIDASKWALGNKMVLAYVNGKPYIHGELPKNGKFEINPVLESFFLMNNLFANNIYIGMSGTEADIEVKQRDLTTTFNAYYSFITNNLSYKVDRSRLTLVDIATAINNAEKSPLTDKDTLKALRILYASTISAVETDALILQNKRNMFLPSTERPLLQKTWNGMEDTMTVAAIDDMLFLMTNPSGKEQYIEGHNGQGWVDPFTAILINNSLLDHAVNWITKPICYFRDDRTATTGLLKFGVQGYSNEYMRSTYGNQEPMINWYNLFKKMTNIRWGGDVNLIGESALLTDSQHPNGRLIGFYQNILLGNNLYYSIGKQNYKIIGFGRTAYLERGKGIKYAYYTREILCDEFGNELNVPVEYVYHFFDSNSEHVTVRRNEIEIPEKLVPHNENDQAEVERINARNLANERAFRDALRNLLIEIEHEFNYLGSGEYHTIDSLFELHKALGGIYCKDINKTTKMLDFAETNNQAVVNFMLHVTQKQGESIIQPLKRRLINMIVTQSAFKRGVGNINPATAFIDKNPLSTMEISTKHYGSVLDSDKPIEDSEITEQSLMVNAIAAVIGAHLEAADTYEALGSLIKTMSQKEFDEFLVYARKENPNKSLLYDTLVRMMIMNYRGNHGLGFGQEILNRSEKVINKNADHINDSFKVAWSDPLIAASMLSVFAGILNDRVMKRKFPGEGNVMVASHGMCAIYEIDGLRIQYDDLLRRALASGITPETETTDTALYNHLIVDRYLRQKLAEQNAIALLNEDGSYSNVEKFLLLDNVFFMPVGESNNAIFNMSAEEIRQRIIRLDDIKEYRAFKDNPLLYIVEHKLLSPTLIEALRNGVVYQRAIIEPRDLRPKTTTWEYRGKDGKWHMMNTYDDYRIGPESMNNASDRLQFFDDLSKGIYHPYANDNYTCSINNNRLRNVRQINMEMVMPYPYANKFGVQDMTLDLIRSEGQAAFGSLNIELGYDDYALALLKRDGLHQYITFNNISKEEQLSKVQVKPVAANDPNGRIWSIVYAIDLRGERLYQVGRDRVVEDVVYDNGLFKSKNKKGLLIAVKDQSKYVHIGNGKVAERIFFVQRTNLSTEAPNTMYHISRETIQNLLMQGESTTDIIGLIIGDIYNTDMFICLRPSIRLAPETHATLQGALDGIAEKVRYNKLLYDYIYHGLKRVLRDVGTSLEVDNKGKVQNKYVRINSDLNNLCWEAYMNVLTQQVQSSFELSLTLIQARIPGQGPLSAMAADIVAFTRFGFNQVYISHNNIWLLESDFDADKCWFMGYSFDGSGRFIGWSNLFDYSTPETLKASLLLPLPKGKVYKESTGVNKASDWKTTITTFVNRITNSNATAATKVSALAELATYLNHVGDTDFYVNPRNTVPYRQVMAMLNDHEATNMPIAFQEHMQKNFVAANLERIVGAMRNTLNAYTPTNMDHIRDLGDAILTTGNIMDPTFKLYLQWLNLLAKETIAIMANGQMTSFYWLHCLNNLLKNPEEFLKYGLMNFKTTRILDRSKDPTGLSQIKTAQIDILPETGKGIDGALKIIDGLKTSSGGKVMLLHPDIATVHSLSEYISSAADNAKNPVLVKINAVGPFATMHLFLVTVGHSINDTTAFMTSPVARFIAELTQENIYNSFKLSMKDAIKVASGDYSPIVDIFLAPIWNILKSSDREKLNKGDTSNLSGIKADIGSSEYNAFHDIVDTIDMINDIRRRLKYDVNNKNDKADLAEFKNVYEAADEFGKLGQILQAKRKLPTSSEDLSKELNSFAAAYLNRVRDYNSDARRHNEALASGEEKNINDKRWKIVNERTMDPNRFMLDEDYRKRIIDNYNIAKKTVNIFYVFNELPITKATENLLYMLSGINDGFSMRSRMLREVKRQMSEYKTFGALDPEAEPGVSDALDNVFIHEYLRLSLMMFPYASSDYLISSNWELVDAASDGAFLLSAPHNLATFKMIFEQKVIPMLRNGDYYDYVDGELKLRHDSSLMSNAFIESLQMYLDHEIQKVRTNTNMYTLNSSIWNSYRTDQQRSGLQQLVQILICGHSLADWFSVYNLIVNKNRAGRDRMTAIFNQFVNKENTFIGKYEKWLGDIDYSYDTLLFSLLDVLRDAAPVVDSLYNQKMPYVILKTKSGLKLYSRAINGKYHRVEGGDVITRLSNESEASYLNRLAIYQLFAVCGGGYTLSISDIRNALIFSNSALALSENQLNDRFKHAILQMMVKGFVDLRKVCKGKNCSLYLTIGNKDTYKFNIKSTNGGDQIADLANVMSRLDRTDESNDLYKVADSLEELMQTTPGSRIAYIADIRNSKNEDIGGILAWTHTWDDIVQLHPELNLKLKLTHPVYIRLVNSASDLMLSKALYGRILNSKGYSVILAENTSSDIKAVRDVIAAREYLLYGDRLNVFTDDSKEYATLKEIYLKLHKGEATGNALQNMMLHFIEHADEYDDIYLDNGRNARAEMDHIMKYVSAYAGDVYYNDPFVDEINAKILFKGYTYGKWHKASITSAKLYESMSRYFELQLLAFGVKDGKTLAMALNEDEGLPNGIVAFLNEQLRKEPEFRWVFDDVTSKNEILFKSSPRTLAERGITMPMLRAMTKVDEYLGYNIYQRRTADGKLHTYVSREVLSLSSIARDLLLDEVDNKIDEAKKYIDSLIEKQSICKNAIVEMKMRMLGANKKPIQRLYFNSRQAYIQGAFIPSLRVKLNPNTVFRSDEALFLSLALTLHDLYTTIRSWGDIDTLTKDRAIKELNTPEKAMIFLYRINEEFGSNRNDSSGIAGILDEIQTAVESERDYYYVLHRHDRTTKEMNYAKDADKRLPHEYNIIYTDGKTAAKAYTEPRLPIMTHIDAIENAINAKLPENSKIVIHKDTIDDIKALEKEEGIKIKHDAKAFVHNGEIHINVTLALPTDLLHEYVHLFLAIMKANPETRENYEHMMYAFSQNKAVASTITDLYNLYKGKKAYTDIVEEAFADRFGKFVMDQLVTNMDGDISGLFTIIQEEMASTVASIFDANDVNNSILKIFSMPLENGFMLFNNDVARLLQNRKSLEFDITDNTGKRNPMRVLNWISEKIRNKEIIEKCK